MSLNQQYWGYGGSPYPYPCCPPADTFPKRKAAASARLQQMGQKHPSAHLVEHANKMTQNLVNILPTCAAFMCNSYGFSQDGRVCSERFHLLNDHYKNYREDASEFINSMEQPPVDKISHPNPVVVSPTGKDNGYKNIREDVDRHINQFTPIPSFKWTWPRTQPPRKDQVRVVDITKQPCVEDREVMYRVRGPSPRRQQNIDKRSGRESIRSTPSNASQ